MKKWSKNINIRLATKFLGNFLGKILYRVPSTSSNISNISISLEKLSRSLSTSKFTFCGERTFNKNDILLTLTASTKPSIM